MVLLHPITEGVLIDSDLFTDQPARGTHSQRGFAGQLLIDHTHSTVTNFCRVLTRCRHVPILSVRSNPPPYPGRSNQQTFPPHIPAQEKAIIDAIMNGKLTH
nr:hypothetical protein GCM10023233_08490 [Brevibacterium otitidis]